MDVVTKEIGKDLDLKLALDDGKVKLSAELDLLALVEPVLLKLKEKIPGEIDDKIIDAVIAKVKELLNPAAPAA